MGVKKMCVCLRGSWGINTLQLIQFRDIRFSIFETNRTIFLKIRCNYIHIRVNFFNKKFERLRDSLQVFPSKFLQKMKFFQIFFHIWNQLDELVGKMVLFFKFDQNFIFSLVKPEVPNFDFFNLTKFQKQT